MNPIKILAAALAGQLFVNAVHAQAPSLLWTTNVGATVFAADANTNVYASRMGLVIRLNGNGVPLETNTICPLPGVAQRDAAGNFYFAGSFDGTQNFGGITLVGGCTNCAGGEWSPGWPSGFLAKYSGAGVLQWVFRFGPNGLVNEISSLALDSANNIYVGYGSSGKGTVATFNSSGSQLTNPTLDSFNGVSFALKIGATTSSNCSFFLFRYSGEAFAGRVNLSGDVSWAGTYPLRWRSYQSSNAVPAIDDLAQLFEVGMCFNPLDPPSCTTQNLRKYSPSGAEVFSRDVMSEAHWTLARDAQSNVYVAGTNSMLAKYDSAGSSVWSNNFSRQIISMLVDDSGNRFVSFADGGVARIESEPTPVPPVITSNPQPGTVFIGDPVNFSVSATGTLPFKYQWRLNGEPIAGATNSTYFIGGTAISNAGNYSVVVSNVADAVTSAPALLRVKSVQLYLGSQLLTNGTYYFAVPPTLSIHSAFANGSSFYTLDGSAPSFSSTFYSGPFAISNTATVRAIGYSDDFFQSEEADSVNLVIATQQRLSVFSSGGGVVTTNLNWNPYTQSCVPLPSDAAAWWRGEGNTMDSFGGHPGALLNGAGYTNGEVGQAFNLDIAGMHVRVPDSVDLRFTNAMTAEAWIYYPASSGTIVSKWSAGTGSQSAFELRIANNPVGSHNLVFAISPNGNNYVACTGGPVPVGSWSHVAGTFDGSYVRLYINGVQAAVAAYSGTIFSGNSDLGIGATVGDSIQGWTDHPYRGLIDEITLYRRALSAAEIQAVYQTGTNGKCTTVNVPFTGGSFVSTNIVTVKAIPQPGNTFLYWLGDASGTNPVITVSMEGDKSIYAVFGTTLSTTVAGNGHVELSPSGGKYPYGTVIRLTGVPDVGNYFGFWGNAATGNTNPLYFTISTPTQTVSSVFGAVPAGQTALTVQINGSGRVNVSPRANVYLLNTSVTLSAVPDAGQTFVDWSGDAGGTANPLNISMTGDEVIVANFSDSPMLLMGREAVEGHTPRGFRITVVSDPPAVHSVYGSTNLSHWAFLGTVTNETLEAQFLDVTATNAPMKFYKIIP
jgi:hypothetical protein